MAGVALVNAIVFGVYGNIQKRSADPNSIKTHFWAGSAAGLIQSVITSPMELAKTRMQLQSHLPVATQFRGPLDCVRHIHRTEGIRGIFRGFGITAVRDVPGFASYFVLYELMIRTSPCPGAFHTLVAGGMAGMLSWVLSCPIDVVKTRLQADSGATARYSGIRDCVLKSYQAEGWSFLTKGMTSTLIRAFIMNAVCFYVVAYTLKAFDDTKLDVSMPQLETITIPVEASFLPPVIKYRESPAAELCKTLNYMGALSDAVASNEIMELANDLYDDLDNCKYYNLNVNELRDYRSITGYDASGAQALRLLLSD